MLRSRLVKWLSTTAPQSGVGSGTAPPDEQVHLERLRHVYEQLKVINENSHRFLSMFLSIATAIVTAALALFVGRNSFDLSVSEVKFGFVGLLSILTFTTLFTVLGVVSGVIAWFEYRNEECDLHDRLIGPEVRPRPTIRAAWKWYETQFIVLMIATTSGLWVLVVREIFPLI